MQTWLRIKKMSEEIHRQREIQQTTAVGKKRSQADEGWSPIQATQPRHNLQVSFHEYYINWSTVKVIQSRMQ